MVVVVGVRGGRVSLPTRDYRVFAPERKVLRSNLAGVLDVRATEAFSSVPTIVDCHGVLRQPYPLQRPLHHQK